MKYLMKLSHWVCIFCLLGCTGCTRLVQWGRKKIYQGQDVTIPEVDAKQYMRSIRMYHQLKTEIFINALWLSEAVRTWYVQTYVRKHGKDLQTQTLMLHKQHAENHHAIAFYITSYIPNIDTMIWSEKNARWALRLQINDKEFEPTDVRIVELPPEYQLLFGKAYNKFRTVYLVKFNARDERDMPLITADVQFITLHVAMADRQTSLTWNII